MERMYGKDLLHPKHSPHPIHPSSDAPLHVQTRSNRGCERGAGEIIMISSQNERKNWESGQKRFILFLVISTILAMGGSECVIFV